MSEENKVQVAEHDNWIIWTFGSRSYIGPIAAVAGVSVEGTFVTLESIAFALQEDVRGASPRPAKGTITLKPAFDYSVVQRPVQQLDEKKQPTGQVAWAREPLCATRGFDLHPCPVHLFLGAGVEIEFLREKHEEDKRVYLGFVANALARADMHRAGQANIKPPTLADIENIKRSHVRRG